MDRRLFSSLILSTLASTNAQPAKAENNIQSNQNRFIVDVREYGAVGDGVHDDTSAINTAINAVRKKVLRVGDNGFLPKLLFSCGVYLISDTLDLTNLHGFNTLIDGDASVIVGKCTGSPVIDAFGSRWLTIINLNIVGDPQNTPSIGIQLGLAEKNQPADCHSFYNLKITGSFSTACILNRAAETTLFSHILLWNHKKSKNSYCLIQDGPNHFDAKSKFIQNSMPSNDDNSFNENIFTCCDFRHSGGGIPVWLCGTSRHEFQKCYAAGEGRCAFELAHQKNMNSFLYIDCHNEGSNLASIIYFSGQRSEAIRLTLIDHNPFSKNYALACDDEAFCYLEAVDIQLGSFHSSQARMFSDRSQWKVNGDVYCSHSQAWNGDGFFLGNLKIADFMRPSYTDQTRVSIGDGSDRMANLSSAQSGKLFYDSSSRTLWIWIGTKWEPIN